MEGCREGRRSGSLEPRASTGKGTSIRGGSGRPRFRLLMDSTPEEAGGASGGREQVGPVQAQGLVGSRVSGFVETELAGVRSIWVG
jgi:hypothetical protein